MTSSPPATSRSDAAPLTYFVDGMDCASCVQKVEQMVGRLPGTAEVKTSFNKHWKGGPTKKSPAPSGLPASGTV